MNHYTFLDNNIDSFFIKVFGKTLVEMNLDDIVLTHGDKCYQYQDDWEEAGIPFHHGAMLYMLTYTEKLGNTPKSESCEWVIQNYSSYKPILSDLKAT